MADQISLYPDILGTQIESIVEKECDRTKNEEHDGYINAIRSLHEGYGYTAEEFANLSKAHKKLKDNLAGYLNMLSNDVGNMDMILSEVYGSAQEAAKHAVRVSAIAKRIMEEVRYDEGLPSEAYGETETEELEFDETEDIEDGEE